MSVRTLIVDDSATMRALIARTLSRDPEIEVIDSAGNAQEAREKIRSLSPDVITLDVEMPGMDGIAFLEKIMTLRPMPVVMLSTLTGAGTDASIRALEIGAFDCVPKPAYGSGDEEFQSTVISTVKAAGKSGRRTIAPRRTPERVSDDYRPREGSLIALGASTGGVEALLTLLGTFPANCPPTVIVQHMPERFTTSFAERLDRKCAPRVCEATHGAKLVPGQIYLAPGGSHHLEIRGYGPWHCRLVDGGRVSGHRPSVDQMFHSVARFAAGKATGALLTGMGADGAEGLKAMRDAGSLTIGQDETSCVVFGMPGVAAQIGAVSEQLPLTRIAARLLEECRQ